MDPTTDLRITTYPVDGYTVVAVHGELDIATAPALREGLLDVLHHQGAQIVVDLSGVRFCDATGLGALVATGRRAQLLGGTVRLASPQDRVAKVIRLTRLDQYFGVYATTAAATRPLSAPSSGGYIRNSVEALVQQRPVYEHTTRTWEHVHADEIREAVGTVLEHTDAWHAADPERWLTPTLTDLAAAHDNTDPATVTDAARALLVALTRHPLTPSASVVDDATRLRRLLESGQRTTLQ